MARQKLKRRNEMTLKTSLTVGDLMPPWIDDLSERAFHALARHIRIEPLSDLNTMTKDDLMSIRSIGEKTADEIITARERYNNGDNTQKEKGAFQG